MDKKVLRCKELMAQGLSGDSLIEALVKEFGISAFAADWVIKDAAKVAKPVSTNLKVANRDDHLQMRMDIITDALAHGDSELALKTLQDVAKLQNTYNEAVDKELVVVFKFPEPGGYKPMTREVLNKALEMLRSTDGNKPTV